MARDTTPQSRPIAVTAKRWAPWTAAIVSLVAWIAVQRGDAQSAPPGPAPAPTPSPSASDASSAPPASTESSTVARIEFTTSPPVYATVTWGNARLGKITPQQPLVVERPRDSGPLDVIVRANGFLPVHTRAHTFADSKLQVKLTRPSQKSTLLGYRAPIDAGVEEAPEDAVSPESPEWDMTKPPAAQPTPPAGQAPPAAGP